MKQSELIMNMITSTEAPAVLIAHGTAAAHLSAIAQRGIAPRGVTGRNNWEHTVGSNKRTVYLTSAYALYFASQASAPDATGTLALIEVLPDLVAATRLQADEDAVEQIMRARPKDEPARVHGWDMERRTIWYRSRAHLYPWQDSLLALGTCGHRGIVAPQSLGRVVTVSHETSMDLILRYGLDPIISVQAFYYIGAKYTEAQRWLFGDVATLRDAPMVGPASGLPGIVQYASIHDAINSSTTERSAA